MMDVFIRREETKTHTKRKMSIKDEAEIEVALMQARNAQDRKHWELEEA